MLIAAVDACCLINLLADDLVLAMLAASDERQPSMRFFTPSQVSQEVLYLLKPTQDDPARLERVQVDLSPHRQSGVVVPCDFDSDDEVARFVALATVVDDGEAACLAIAAQRQWLVATDDRVARRLAAQEGIEVITTPTIIRRWADDYRISPGDLARVIGAIGRFAKFVPHRSSPDYLWWMEAALH